MIRPESSVKLNVTERAGAASPVRLQLVLPGFILKTLSSKKLNTAVDTKNCPDELILSSFNVKGSRQLADIKLTINSSASL